jgi:glyoxylase-like metal-dependent hydrolase (beta-lactamase superfamily II)
MDRVDIPVEMIVPMEQVSAGVKGLRIAFVNVFGIQHGDGSWTLIDAALKFTGRIIRSWAEKNFGKPPNALVLSHGHFDHVGVAAELADEWDIPIYAHKSEFPYLTGKREYPAPNAGAGGGLMSLLSPVYPRGPINVGERLREIREGANGALSVRELPGWQVLHTPGHTPGHVSFFRPEDRTLLPADAFCTTKPESFFEAAITQKPELHGPPAYFTWNWGLARQSVESLASLDALVVAPGHGQPLSGPDIPEAVRTLAARFQDIAVPENRSDKVA